MTKVMKEKIANFERQCGKKVVETIHFPSTGTFTAFSVAEKKAVEMGYSVGSMCRDEPIGLAKDVGYIAKWHNIDSADKAHIEAGILSCDFREGDAVIAIFG